MRIFNILKIEAKFLDNIYDLQLFMTSNGQWKDESQLNESMDNSPLINKGSHNKSTLDQVQMNYD